MAEEIKPFDVTKLDLLEQVIESQVVKLSSRDALALVATVRAALTELDTAKAAHQQALRERDAQAETHWRQVESAKALAGQIVDLKRQLAAYEQNAHTPERVPEGLFPCDHPRVERSSSAPGWHCPSCGCRFPMLIGADPRAAEAAAARAGAPSAEIQAQTERLTTRVGDLAPVSCGCEQSLLDQFASAALPEILGRLLLRLDCSLEYADDSVFAEAAKLSYKASDALLAEKKRREAGR